MPYHNLGREVFMVPVTFTEDGWFYAGIDKTAEDSYEIKGDFIQREKGQYTFENTDWSKDWCFLRHPDMNNYKLSDGKAVLHGTDKTLDDVASPTFIALRQREFNGELTVKVKLTDGEAGITAFMCESEHYDIAVRKTESGYEAVEKLNIGEYEAQESEMEELHIGLESIGHRQSLGLCGLNRTEKFSYLTF